MAIFAIYPKDTDSQNIGPIKECQLNLWMLPALLARKKWIVEVGLILNPATIISGIEVAFPFHVIGNPVDLADHIKDRISIQRLLFTKEGNYPSNFIQVSSFTPVLEQKQFTRLRVNFDRSLAPGTESYLRFRLEVENFANRLQWRRAFGISSGATLDFRVSDLRELSSHEEEGKRSQAILSIERLRIFVIMPVWLQYRYSSPTAHYLRLIESAGWEEYLHRKCHLGRAFSICQIVVSDVSRDTPFRGYLDYERSTVDTLIRILFIFLLLGLSEVIFLLLCCHYFLGGMLIARHHIGALYNSPLSLIGVPFGAVLIISIMRSLIKALHALPEKWRRIDRLLHRLDNWFLNDPCFGKSRHN